MRLYIVGGRQRDSRRRQLESGLYEQALIIGLDAETGRLERVTDYISPPEVGPENPSVVFKAATLEGDRLYACTQTEVLIYRVPGFEIVASISLPVFNDLHHVRPLPGNELAVVSTGLDMVFRIDRNGRIKQEWDVLGHSPWRRFSRDVDYRLVPSTKPHESHPNYTFVLGEDLWVTRLLQKDALCLTREREPMNVGVQRPHDGVVHQGRVYFTTVDGHIVVCDGESGERLDVIDLHLLQDRRMALGWCRGLEVLDRGLLVVGFSRLRPTKTVENVQWAKHMLGMRDTVGDLPSRVALVDLAAKKMVWEVAVEDVHLNAVFSIHRAP